MSSLYGLVFDVSSGSMVNSTNSRHIQPRCFDSKLDNFTGSLKNYDAKDGGIPITFGLNCLGWMIVFLLFCVIRRLVWDYGRLALIQKGDQGWTEMFYGSNEVNGEREAPDGESQLKFPKVKQKGLFSWIPVYLRITDEHIRLKCGIDAFQYIVFQKHLLIFAVIIFCLSVGIVLPVNYSGQNDPDSNSFGATTVSNLNPNSSIFWLHTVFAIVYFIVMLLILRHFSNLFPLESGNNSSNTIMITNIPKSVTADLIQEHFQEIYGKPQILEVQLAYDFSKLKAAHRKVLAAQIGRQHCEEILQKTGQRPLTTVSTNKLSPCCQCCGASHVDGIEYFTEEEEAGKTEASEHRQKLKSLGIAFVTFQDPKVVQRCLKDFNTVKHGSPESSVSRKIFCDHWNVTDAPLSGNIIWEHLSVDYETVVLTTLRELKASVEKESQFDRTSCQSVSNTVPANYSSVELCSSSSGHCFVVKLLRSSLDQVQAGAFCDGEDLHLLAVDDYCVAVPCFNKVSPAVTSSIPDISRVALVTSALIGTALELCRFPELVSYAGNMACARNEGEKRLIRKEAVREFPFGQQYAGVLVIFSVMVIYSITCPLVTPFGLLYLGLKHFVDRYNLYFNYRAPAYKYMDSGVHSLAVTYAMLSTFFLLLSLLFFSIIRLGIDDPQTVFTFVVVTIAVLLLALRVCFGMFKRFGPHKEALSNDAELNGAEIYIPISGLKLLIHVPYVTREAYLPPVLQTTRNMTGMGSSDDVNPPQLTRRKTYGSVQNDHVIDASQLTPSSETVLTFTDEDHQ
ncbi:Calcium permeable stress-gated cation channel 1 [Acropora cervicornis]|uniref:Calcium permeable stress-gated cation channel 1 n=1 Tax=Acropora cervicornis TaxID=6130 RepID=A0AAD9V5A4_ACRCE|nr:Calcium permeable stress-gated cation channel 1 [Acropora cervicornis]